MFCNNSQQNGVVLQISTNMPQKCMLHTQPETETERARKREPMRERESQREPERARKSQRFSQSSQSLVLSVMRYTNHTSRFLVLTKVPQQLRLIALTQLTQSTQQLTEQTSKSNNCASNCANNCTNHAEEVPREI